jgi:epoxyqueuosine reductase QueG
MPLQKDALHNKCGARFNSFMQAGSIVSIAIRYEEPYISSINQSSEGEVSIRDWNIYAAEYEALNKDINCISSRIAEAFEGIALPATWDSTTRASIKHVRDYFGEVVSHRAVAEVAGLGWRGKNGLIINEHYSCAIRFASIILTGELEYTARSSQGCEGCTACEEACSFIRHRAILPDYRDNCRRFIDHLKSKGLIHDVCGKCIKACYFESIYSDQFDLDISK